MARTLGPSRSLVVVLAVALALAGTPPPASALAGAPEARAPLVLVHNGSVQGVLGPESGGVQARTATLLAEQRRLAPELVLVSCGNQFGPSVTSRVDGGALAVDLMNRAGYDAQALGPHDLFAGSANFLKRVGEARFPVVCSNLEVAAADRAAGDWTQVKPWVKVERAGRSVLVLAIVEPFAVRNWPQWPAGLTMTDPVTALQKARDQAGPADLTVVLGTMSSVFGFGLQRELPWVDLVIVHPAAHEVVPVEESFLSQRLDGRLLIWSACHGAQLARVEASWESVPPARAALAARALPVAAALAADLAVEAEVAALEVRARGGEGEVLCALTDAERAAFPEALMEALRYELRAEVAVMHRGAVRLRVPPATLTRAALGSAFPFPDRAALLSVEGAALRRLWARRNMRLINDEGLVVVGLGERGGRLFVNGRPLDDAERYRVATTEFLALGGLGLLPKTETSVRADGFSDVVGGHFTRYAKVDRARLHARAAARPIVRHHPTFDFALNRLDFGGSAPAYQYSDPGALFTGSDIPRLSGQQHRQYAVTLHQRTVVDRPASDLTFDLNLRYMEFNQYKLLDRGVLDVTYEDKSGRPGGHFFARGNLTGTVLDPEVPGHGHPLFGLGAAGLAWRTSPCGKLYVGLAQMTRFAQEGDPSNTGLALRYEFTKSWQGRTSLTSSVNLFGSADDESVRTVDWETTLRFRLGSSFSTYVTQSTYLWEDDVVGSTARQTELTVGVSFDRLTRRF